MIRAPNPVDWMFCVTVSASSERTSATMPIPQLKMRRISSSSTLPSDCIQSNSSGRVQLSRLICADRPSGRTRGTFSVRPPPVMWASARAFSGIDDFPQVRFVNRGGLQQRLQPVRIFRRRVQQAVDEREAVGVHAAGVHPDQNVSRLDIRAGEQSVALCEADAESGKGRSRPGGRAWAFRLFPRQAGRSRPAGIPPRFRGRLLPLPPRSASRRRNSRGTAGHVRRASGYRLRTWQRGRCRWFRAVGAFEPAAVWCRPRPSRTLIQVACNPAPAGKAHRTRQGRRGLVR